MSGFKLLAIRPLNDKLAKVLEPGKLYRFSKKYDFSMNDAESIKPSLNKNYKNPSGIYDIERNGSNLQISVSAIVGKNGSGKSSLLELLYGFCYLIAAKKGDLKKLYSGHKAAEVNKEEYPEKINDILDELRLEMFYELDGTVHRLSRKVKNITHATFNEEKWVSSSFSASEYFYNVVINYSIYGLNERITPWLWALFHKNDGYITPIVINPMREHGRININLEYDLAQARLMTNLVMFKNNEILENRIVNHIELRFTPMNLRTIWVNETERPFNSIVAYFRQFYKKTIDKYFLEVFKESYNLDLSIKEIESFETITYDDNSRNDNSLGYEQLSGFNSKREVSPESLRYYIFKYCIRKVYKILMAYYPSEIEFVKGDKTINGIPEQNYSNVILATDFELPRILKKSSLIRILKKDRSHKTLKLRQAINLLKFDALKRIKFEVDNFVNSPFSTYKTSFGFNEYSKLVNSAYERADNRLTEMIEFVPAAMFKPKLILKRGRFDELSSGEQQFLHSIHSILYHLKNLDSIHIDSNRKDEDKYSQVNVIMDEVELYFHPEMQRTYFKELRRSMKRINLDNLKSINFLFSTHSPFILSDIASDDVLFLENRSNKTDNDSKEIEIQNTFGANINEMLISNFFMRNTIGAFAKEKIVEIVDFYNDVSKAKVGEHPRLKKQFELFKEQFQFVANSIGDTVIQNIIQNNLTEIESILYKIDPVELRKKHLREELKRLEKNAKD